jgi:hypothetical protein
MAAVANWRHPAASGATLTREMAKQVLARWGNRKYSLHAPNQTIRPVRLRDGQCGGYEFLRCNPHWKGVSSHDTGWGIGEVLTERFLDRLTVRHGTCVLYTHLGKLGPGRRAFDATTIHAFRRLADYHRSGKILVTTTRRLLDMCSANQTGSTSGGLTADWARLTFPQL